MANYLLEIGVEELPAGFVPEAEERLRELLKNSLSEANISFQAVQSYSTPRRLTAVVEGIAEKQTTTEKKVKGPAVKNSFDAAGKATAPAAGFAAKHGLTPEKLEREEIAGVEYLVARVVLEGQATRDVLPELVNKVISQISGERLMRWGDCEVKFSRPLRWIVSLLDKTIVNVEIANLKASNKSRGHRILHPQEIEINDAESYEAALQSAFVIVDPKKRKAAIAEQVAARAKELGGSARQLDSGLLDEVINLTEWPSALVGEFEHDYLALPATLIETIMIHHQRYFPIEAADSKADEHKLLPFFVTITNNDRTEAKAHIKQGNERVLRARLADGKFFYFDDRKIKLEERTEALGKLTYQEGLGSYGDKTERLCRLAQVLSDSARLNDRETVCLERACQLMKLDLVSNLVRELPELQGYVGSWYARAEGEPADVAAAIVSHYSPRGGSDGIPADRIGQLAAVLDKIDHIVGLFALGHRPSGSSDPYALRRSAQGLIDILVDGLVDLPLNLTMLINSLLMAFEPLVASHGKKFEAESVSQEVHEFLVQRLRGKLMDTHSSREAVEAVLGSPDPLSNLTDVLIRLKTVMHLIGSPGGNDLMRVGVRVGNILKADSPEAVDEKLLEGEAEKLLWEAFKKNVQANWEKNGRFVQPQSEAEYQSLLDLQRQIIPHVDRFFEETLVNDQDKAKRDNRHGILKHIDRYYRSIADFTKLQPLIS